MSKIKIPKMSEKKILKILEKRDYEDLGLIADIEKNILKRRDYVVSPLKEGENVILLLSGGLDSVAVWGMLLKHYKVNVYPFYSSRGFKFGEERSMWYYSHLFKNLKGFHPIFKSRSFGHSFSFSKKTLDVPPELILKYFAPHMDIVMTPNSGSNFIIYFYAAYYRIYLWWERNIKVDKIICGVTAEDGIEIYTQTQTFLRQTMLSMMLMLQDSSLEFFSLGLDKDLGCFLTKKDFLNISQQLRFSLKNTHTCDTNSHFHCGHCSQCKYRNSVLFSTN